MLMTEMLAGYAIWLARYIHRAGWISVPVDCGNSVSRRWWPGTYPGTPSEGWLAEKIRKVSGESWPMYVSALTHSFNFRICIE